MQHFDVVIVGTGHGGSQAAIALRQQGFTGSIAMVGKDAEPPYERPPLSKEYLAREKAFERIMTRPVTFWSDKDVDLLLGAEVTQVDAARREVMLRDGRKLSFGDLVWSAGGTARRLSCEGGDLEGIHTIRDKADVDAILARLDSGARHVIVVGGGYIGLEAAAVLRKLGCEVTLLEALDRVLARVAGEPISRFFEVKHRARGVDLRLKTAVDHLVGDGTRVTGVSLDSGEILPCDMVIVGIGMVPSTGPVVDAGADAGNGIEVDEHCRTSLPHIYAIGDCAARASRFADGERVRLESVQNANDMATAVARAICGGTGASDPTPWFWSNQYDLKLQTVGLSQRHDSFVLRGNPADRSFSVIYLKEDRVIALDCVNATKDYVQGRKLVEAGALVAPDLLADPDIPIKEMMAIPACH